jgi:hypothetical protein
MMIEASRHTGDPRRTFGAGVLHGLVLQLDLVTWYANKLKVQEKRTREAEYEWLMSELNSGYVPSFNEAVVLIRRDAKTRPESVVGVVKINDDGTFCAETKAGGNHNLSGQDLQVLLNRALEKVGRAGNAINVIYPYFHGCTWVFDDKEHGLVKEPFVAGAETLITLATKLKGIPDAEDGFRLTFSAGEFPDYDLKFDWVRSGQGGNYYKCDQLGGREGWLCPALFKYFPTDAPKNIFVGISAK